MGLIKKIKSSWKDATTEKTNFGNPDRTDSLSKGIASWLDRNSSKTIRIILAIAACAVVIAAIVWSFYKVYGKTEDTTFIASESASSSAEYESRENSIAYFENMQDWIFLGTNKEKVADEIYLQLKNLGMSEGTIVYCLGNYQQEESGYVCFIRESDNSKYYKVAIDSQQNVTLTEIDKASIPSTEEEKQLDEDSKAATEEKQRLESAYKGNSDVNTDIKVDITNGSTNILLTDTEALANYLPTRCAELLQSSLITGMKDAYGFNAVAGASSILPESKEENGSQCSFIAQMVDSYQNVLLLWVTWDGDSETFSGQRIQN